MARSRANPPDNAPRAWAGYRSKHRQRSHDEAHANGDGTPPPPLIDDPLVPAHDPPLITDAAALRDLLDTLRAAGEVAYDTEFIGEQSYYPRLCLIQVATADAVALIDPLAGLDLAGFWELLTDPSVTTVVHAGLQDLEPIVRHAGRPVGRVFDTQVAAGFAGLDYPVSLAKLVDALIGGELDQGPKFSRWDQRPLSAMQRAYAANDVRYLLLLRRRVAERVAERGNAAALDEELDTLRDPALQQTPPSLDKVKARGVSRLSRRRRTRLRSLLLWRDDAARRLDMPPRAVVPDETLVTVACENPADRDALWKVRGLPRPVKEQFTGEMLDTLREGEAAPLVPAVPRSRKPSDEEKAKVEAIWAEVQAVCEERGIATAIACNRKEIAAWALDRKRRPALRDRLLDGWRDELLGPTLRPVEDEAATT